MRNIDNMGFEQPFQPEPEEEKVQAPKPEKTGFSEFVGKVKTGIVLTAALASLGGNIEAQGAGAPRTPDPYSEKGSVNDATRNDRFYAFTERYTEAVKMVKKAKTPDDAAKTLNSLNSAVTFVEASRRHTAGQNPSLDKRYAVSLKDMKKAAEGLQKFGVTFDSARLDAMVTSFELHREVASHPPKKPNNGWIKTETMGRTSLGVDIRTGSSRPAPRTPPKK